jgi:hypothetical protein
LNEILSIFFKDGKISFPDNEGGAVRKIKRQITEVIKKREPLLIYLI